ncbi:MBOAT family O-acyltransferase [Sulfurovum sp. NBC37-1]|uniref:MBOAT family O-acyltransferase n=1 Tax=Sulfurovum sp. (strain NBC37-1) TaxID=387093 RepID=UPI0001587B60|nr:MBOAT family protein [Sulfurovum sp. NBC37-1]BAF72485.1 alginate O-acetyltransferase [Sulfurovum sp. NBC37-1]
MLFNSYEFIFAFLPFTFFVYFYLNQKRLTEAAKAFLVFASLFFYSWWNIAYLPIILVSMLFNYVVGVSLSKKNEHSKVGKRNLLIFGIAANVALLGYFKYADFFIENVNYVAGSHLSLLHLALPLGISFFTFQQIAYLVDSSRGETKEYDFLNYANFVTFFPQLIAGPIVHHAEMMPQFAAKRNKVRHYSNIAKGLFIFSIGLFKKVVIADTFAQWANSGFDVATSLNFFEAWATSLSYTFQLYFDFSGYTDMAIGAALLFNIKIPINFNSPYKAVSIQDFWRRWHITLSRFLRDYIYIPLGGNRRGKYRTYYNLMVTFLIGGIWHGAGWTFLFWGFLHGIALVIQKAWDALGFKLHTLLAWFITFNFVNIAWVFFRAKEWNDALKVLLGMAGANGMTLPGFLRTKLSFLAEHHVSFGRWMMHVAYPGDGGKLTVLWLLAGFVLVFACKNSTELLERFHFRKRELLFMLIIFYIAILSLTKQSDFLYFNF